MRVCERRSSISSCWDRISSLAQAGHHTQSASEIPEGGVLITGDLCLRCNRDSSCPQGFSRVDVRYEPSAQLNGCQIGFQPRVEVLHTCAAMVQADARSPVLSKKGKLP
jgi:hypothetical protein